MKLKRGYDMKKIVLAVGILLAAIKAHAAPPPVQDRGAVDQSTSIAIAVTTVPQLILSTGTNMLGAGRVWFPSSPAIPGQYMPDRVNLTVQNQSTRSVWVGFSPEVTATPGVNLGLKIVDSSGTWHYHGSASNIWIVSDDNIPTPQVVVHQSK